MQAFFHRGFHFGGNAIYAAWGKWFLGGGNLQGLAFFSGCVRQPTPFGDSIFLLVKKDRGERHAKGLQSRPLDSGFYTGVMRGDVRRPYEFAVMQFTRFRPVRGVLRTVSTDSIVLLQLRRNRNTYRITDISQTRQSGGRVSLSIFLGTAARRGKGISGAPQPT